MTDLDNNNFSHLDSSEYAALEGLYTSDEPLVTTEAFDQAVDEVTDPLDRLHKNPFLKLAVASFVVGAAAIPLYRGVLRPPAEDPVFTDADGGAAEADMAFGALAHKVPGVLEELRETEQPESTAETPRFSANSPNQGQTGDNRLDVPAAPPDAMGGNKALPPVAGTPPSRLRLPPPSPIPSWSPPTFSPAPSAPSGVLPPPPSPAQTQQVSFRPQPALTLPPPTATATLPIPQDAGSRLPPLPSNGDAAEEEASPSRGALSVGQATPARLTAPVVLTQGQRRPSRLRLQIGEALLNAEGFGFGIDTAFIGEAIGIGPGGALNDVSITHVEQPDGTLTPLPSGAVEVRQPDYQNLTAVRQGPAPKPEGSTQTTANTVLSQSLNAAIDSVDVGDVIGLDGPGGALVEGLVGAALEEARPRPPEPQVPVAEAPAVWVVEAETPVELYLNDTLPLDPVLPDEPEAAPIPVLSADQPTDAPLEAMPVELPAPSVAADDAAVNGGSTPVPTSAPSIGPASAVTTPPPPSDSPAVDPPQSPLPAVMPAAPHSRPTPSPQEIHDAPVPAVQEAAPAPPPPSPPVAMQPDAVVSISDNGPARPVPVTDTTAVAVGGHHLQEPAARDDAG